MRESDVENFVRMKVERLDPNRGNAIDQTFVLVAPRSSAGLQGQVVRTEVPAQKTLPQHTVVANLNRKDILFKNI